MCLGASNGLSQNGLWQHAVLDPGRHASVCLAAGTAEVAAMLEAGLEHLERATVLAGAGDGVAAGAGAHDQQPYWCAAPVPQPRSIMAS